MAFSYSPSPGVFPARSAPFDVAARPQPAFSTVAILGFGTVGRSVARILCEHPRLPLRLTHVCNRNIERKRVDWLREHHVHWTENMEDVLSSDVDVVVELVGGLEPAGDWVRRALRAGKSVVTANKQLIAHHGVELSELAHRHHGRLLFGASVAGGVPVIPGLEEGLAGDVLFRLCGILNGTCNFILTRMESDGVSFDAALREAQQLGFAEADPTEDVEGFDARAKLAILARVGLHTQVHPREIGCASVATIGAVDFEYAHQLGCTIRQVSCAELREDHLLASVQPSLVPLASPLARVQGSQNLVMATGRFGGETVFSGYGAGGDPTAVAVVADLVAIHRARRSHSPEQVEESPVYRAVSGDFRARHYLRFTIRDRLGIIAALAGILSRHGINIDAVLQNPGFPRDCVRFVITLEECSASALDAALKEMSALDFLVEPTLALPILS